MVIGQLKPSCLDGVLFRSLLQAHIVPYMRSFQHVHQMAFTFVADPVLGWRSRGVAVGAVTDAFEKGMTFFAITLIVQKFVMQATGTLRTKIAGDKVGHVLIVAPENDGSRTWDHELIDEESEAVDY